MAKNNGTATAETAPVEVDEWADLTAVTVEDGAAFVKPAPPMPAAVAAIAAKIAEATADAPLFLPDNKQAAKALRLIRKNAAALFDGKVLRADAGKLGDRDVTRVYVSAPRPRRATATA